jgi:hypothetical protein
MSERCVSTRVCFDTRTYCPVIHPTKKKAAPKSPRMLLGVAGFPSDAE